MASPRRQRIIACSVFAALYVFCAQAAHGQEQAAALLRKAETLIAAKKYSEALGVYESLVAAHPSCAEAYRGIVTCYGQLGNPHGAVKYMDSLCLEYPQRAEVFYGRGVALYTVGKYDAAAAAFKQAVTLNPELAAAWNNAAVIEHFVRRDYAAARQYYEKAITVGTRTGNTAVTEIARTNLANLPRPEDQRPLSLEEFMNTFISRAEARDEGGLRNIVLSQKENAEQAMDWLLSKALRAHAAGAADEESVSADLANLLAAEYAAVHASDALKKKYQEYAGLDAERKKAAARGEALCARAAEREQQGMPGEAAAAYREAISCFERSGRRQSLGRAQLSLGDAHRAAKDYRSAFDAYGKALTVFMELRDEPRKALALTSMGIAGSLLGRHEEALDFLKRALAVYAALKDEEAAAAVRRNIELVQERLRSARTGGT